MALNAGYIPIYNKQQAQVTEGQNDKEAGRCKYWKKLNALFRISLMIFPPSFNVMDRSIKFTVDTYKDY